MIEVFSFFHFHYTRCSEKALGCRKYAICSRAVHRFLPGSGVSSSVQPFVKALLRDPVFSADHNPAKLISFQQLIDDRPAEPQDLLKVLYGIASLFCHDCTHGDFLLVILITSCRITPADDMRIMGR